MISSVFAKRRAERLHAQAMKLSDEGDQDAAIGLYLQALDLDASRPNTLYNVGLIYKYRRAWLESFEFNRRAFDLRPDDEATLWNLGIAATALGDWITARDVWKRCGYDIAGDRGPIEQDFGLTPVRLNPDGEAEVVWARRIDPVRARIVNVPFPKAGFFHGDVVLHDGAATGERVIDGRHRPVFNVFERLARSSYATVTATIVAPSEPDLETLIEACDAAGMPSEDWTGNIRWLCKQCSEGVPHDHHDQDLPDPVWRPERELGTATTDVDALQGILRDWATKPGRKLIGTAVSS